MTVTHGSKSLPSLVQTAFNPSYLSPLGYQALQVKVK